MNPTKDEIVQLITILAKYAGLDVQQSLRQCEKESSFDPDAHNPLSGAHGLFQLLAPTARQVGVDRMKPTENVFGGIKYMRYLKDIFGDAAKAYAAYNWGPGNLHELIEQKGDAWRDNLPAETKAYLTFILGD